MLYATPPHTTTNTTTATSLLHRYSIFPQFICCSATISNATELMCKLIPLTYLRHFMTTINTAATNVTAITITSNEQQERDWIKEELNLAVIDHQQDGSPHGER